MYTQTENSWDLRNYRQRTGKTLREYIQCFSKKRNKLPNITDVDVINAFICGMTCKALVHALGRETLHTTRELLEVTTQYATSEKVVQANFSGKAKAPGHLSGGDGDDDPASSQCCRDKMNKDRKRRRKEMVAAVDRAARPQPRRHGACPEHFEKALEAPYPFHSGQAKHLLKDCTTIRGYIRGTLGQ
jgi:hypothetical protein